MLINLEEVPELFRKVWTSLVHCQADSVQMEGIQHQSYHYQQSSNKNDPKNKRDFWEITQNPRVTSKDLQGSHTVANVKVQESTIRQTQNSEE